MATSFSLSSDLGRSFNATLNLIEAIAGGPSLSAIALPMPEAAPVTITTRRGTLMEKVAGTGSHRFGTSCTRLSPSYYGIMYNEQPI